MSKELTTIGALLKRNRDAKGLTLDDIEILYGLNRRTILKLESGKGGNVESLIRYAKALKISIWALPEHLRQAYEQSI